MTTVQKACVAALVFGGIALMLLWQEHRTHILGFLPYLLLAACPLMHIFMHGSHGGHGKADPPDSPHNGGKSISGRT